MKALITAYRIFKSAQLVINSVSFFCSALLKVAVKCRLLQQASAWYRFKQMFFITQQVIRFINELS